ncbi:hypothetical protein BX600DRAFT_550031 [Xylariales sp. PMI_506]|nr:hypothetical protein BX600DRAFT_550031 [Xylariales sp. PMI_506]
MMRLDSIKGASVALMAARLVVAQNSSITSTSILAGVPECALPCMTSTIEAADCGLANADQLASCLCTNIPLQSAINICVQLNCSSLAEQAAAFGVENEVCAGYPIQSRTNVAIITATITIAVSVPIVAARCATRLMFTKRLWSDDYLSIFALIMLLGLAGIEIFSAGHGSGLHYWNQNLDDIVVQRKLFYVSKILYVVVQGVGKIAVLILYQRLFKTPKGVRGYQLAFHRACRVLIVLTFIMEAIYLFLIAFQCLPVASLWDPSIPSTRCVGVTAAWVAGGSVNIAADVALMILPIPILLKLQISNRRRSVVSFMFIVASLGIIASLVRIKYLAEGSSQYDSTWYNVYVNAWSTIELLCVVVCGCVPALKPALSLFKKKIISTITGVNSEVKSTANGGMMSTSRKSMQSRKSTSNFSTKLPPSYHLSPLSSGASVKYDLNYGVNYSEELSEVPRIPERAVRSLSVGNIDPLRFHRLTPVRPPQPPRRASWSGSDEGLILDEPYNFKSSGNRSNIEE